MIRKEYLRLKTTPPEVLHTLLPIKNIADTIDSIPPDEAVFLVAPYGYGKTLSVISWLRERSLNAAWLTLDGEDNQETAFFADLSAAVLRLRGWDGNTDDILLDPGYTADHQGYFWNVVSDAEKSGADRILVIDSFRFLIDPALLAAFKDMILGLLGRWRVVIISRTEPPPLFNDMLLKRKIYLITIKELAFSPEEINAFFSLNGCAISQEEVLEINRRTEGWPASLNVILTLSRGGSVIYSDAVSEYVREFFETEIWRDLSESAKDFLLKTSVLDTLTPALCNAVTEIGATLPMLRWLFVNGLFISRVGGHEAFRYHRTFQSFLREKLRASDIDEAGLYKKVGWWLFETDAYEQAFPYFFKAGDMYGLSRVFRAISSADLGLERYLELTGCVTGLKAGELREYPLIVARMALIHFALGNLDEMQRLYDILGEWIKPGALPLPPEEYEECVWEAGWLSYLNPAEPIEKNQKHNDWVNYTEHNPRLKELQNLRIAVYRFPSVLRGVRDYCPALRSLEEFGLLNQDKDYTYSVKGEAALLQVEIIKAEYAYERENFVLAEKIIRGVMDEVEALRLTDLYLICTVVLTKIARARGSNGSDSMIRRLEKTIIKNGHTFLLPRFHAFELRDKLAEGYIGQTEEFAAENRDYMDKPYFYLLYNHLVLARALLSTGEYHEATMLLGNLERLCHQYGRIMDLIEVSILKSIADYGLGHGDSARRHLMAAIGGAREYGFIRIFSDDAAAIWPILEAVGEEANDDYIRNITISCKKSISMSGVKLLKKGPASAGLTKTELKILGTLRTDMSYEEIAFDNKIKLSTVKSHIHSIYSKLEVGNRTSAIMAAQALGILD